MTIEELTEALQKEGIPGDTLYVCHFAKRAGQVKPIVFPLAELRWLDSRLCLVEEDDLNLYLAEI